MVDFINITKDTATVPFAEKELFNYLNILIKKNPNLHFIPKYDLSVTNKKDIDELSIIQENQKCKIVASNKITLLIGVYQYLRLLGFEFLRPGKKYEYVPIIDDDSLNKEINYHHIASYKYRGICIEGADSLQNILNFIDWLPKVGFNSFFIQFKEPYTFLQRWYQHTYNDYKLSHKKNYSEMFHLIDEAIKIRNLNYHKVGHGWLGEVLGYSANVGWESVKDLQTTDDTLIALVNGKRQLIKNTPIFTSLDFSNPKANKLLADKIIIYARKHPEVNYLHVWLSDECNNVCECKDCQQTTLSDQYVSFLNYLDRRLTVERITTKICFLLYHELLYPPKKEKIINTDRFVMMFAPISRTFEKSFADINYRQDIPEIKPYQRNEVELPHSLEENISFLLGWKKIFKGDTFILDYPLGRAHYGDLGNLKISKILSEDIKFLDKLNLQGYMSCQELRVGLPTNIPNYLMGQLLWDKEQKIDDLINRYLYLSFGNNYLSVKRYLERISELSSPDYFNGIGERKNKKLERSYKKIEEICLSYLDTIRSNLKITTGIQHNNWLILDYHRQVVILLSHALKNKCAGKNNLAEETWKSFVDFIKLHEKQFQPFLDVYRIIEVGTNYAGFQYR